MLFANCFVTMEDFQPVSISIVLQWFTSHSSFPSPVFLIILKQFLLEKYLVASQIKNVDRTMLSRPRRPTKTKMEMEISPPTPRDSIFRTMSGKECPKKNVNLSSVLMAKSRNRKVEIIIKTSFVYSNLVQIN